MFTFAWKRLLQNFFPRAGASILPENSPFNRAARAAKCCADKRQSLIFTLDWKYIWEVFSSIYGAKRGARPAFSWSEMCTWRVPTPVPCPTAPTAAPCFAEVASRPFARIRTATLALALLLPALPAAAQTPPLTEAEQAARDQRPLTEAEQQRLKTLCPLSLAGGTPIDLGGKARFRRIGLGPQTALALVAARRRSEGPTRTVLEPFPPLPNGGIGGRDFCDSVMLFPGGARADGAFSMLALRLRPGLDGAADYPAAWAQAQDNGQIFAWPEGDWAVAQVPGVSRALGVFSAVAGDARVETGLPALYIDDMLLVPLKPER